MPKQAKPIHILQDVKTLTKNKLYPKLAFVDYWHSNRRTEIQLNDILSIECDCEEMVIHIKSDRIKTYTKRVKSAAKIQAQLMGIVGEGKTNEI